MKKRRLAGLMLLAPLTLLCACGGGTSALNLSPNWYSDTTTTSITGTAEELEYEVTFEGTDTNYAVSYDKGYYKTKLSNTVGEDGKDLYLLEAEYRITGRYSLNGTTGDEFEDTMTSKVYFTSAKDGLRPVKSEKTVHTASPVRNPVADGMYADVHYNFTVEYDEALKTASYTVDYLDPEVENLTGTESISASGSYLDNEQILFALRGIDYSSTVTFHSLDPQTLKNTSTGVIEAPTKGSETYSFTLNGKEISETIETAHLTVGYRSTQSGPRRRLVYAARTSAESNTYRNVLLRYENPVMLSLGTMTYTLKSATFNTK